MTSPARARQQDADFDPDKVNEEAINGDKRQSSLWKPSGDDTIRIMMLPPSGKYYVPIYIHFSVGFMKQTFYCPLRMNDERCPVCEYVRGLFATRDPQDEEEAKAISAKPRYLSAIVDLNNQNKGMQIFSYGKKIWEGLEAYRRTPDYAEMFHRLRGNRIQIAKTALGGGAMNVDYKIMVMPKQEALPDTAVVDGALEAIEATITFRSFEQMYQAVHGEPLEQQAAPRPRQAAGPQPRGASSAPRPRAATQASQPAEPVEDDLPWEPEAADPDAFQDEEQQPDPRQRRPLAGTTVSPKLTQRLNAMRQN